MHLLRWSCFFFFSLLIWLITSIGFLIFNQSHLWDKFLLVIMYYPIICCWIQFTGVFLRIFACSWGISICNLFFWLCFQGSSDLIKWVGKDFFSSYSLSFSILWDSSCRIDTILIIWRAKKYCSRQGRAGSVYSLFPLPNKACLQFCATKGKQ